MFGIIDRRNARRASRPLCRGLAVGVSLGLVLGAAGAALSVMGKQAWEGLPPTMQAGYMAGFTDCLRLAKANDPGGWLASNYVIPPVTPIQWSAKVTELYRDKNLEKSPLHQVIILAATRLAAETGYRENVGSDPRVERLREALEKFKSGAAADHHDEDSDSAAGGQRATMTEAGDGSNPSDPAQAEAVTEKPDATGSPVEDSESPPEPAGESAQPEH